MAKVTDRYAAAGDTTVVLCDFSPPRSGSPAPLEDAKVLHPDFFCVAYNPGRAARADSVAVAAKLREVTGREAVFNLSPRDMNALALQTRLLGAQLLGLENVLVLQGDRFTEQELQRVTPVQDYTATRLLRAIEDMNRGVDYRGLKLHEPTDLCAGAAFDLGNDLDREVRLVRRKLESGARFLVSQPVFDVADRERFFARYRALYGDDLTLPVFWGLQVLVAGGVIFSSVPLSFREQLDAGRDGAEIAIELLDRFRAAGIRGVYLVPPILRGGARDYPAAARVLAHLSS